MFYFSQQTAQIIYPVAQKSLDSKKIPYFLEGPVNGDNYLDILQNYVVPGLIMHLLSFNEIYFQNDGLHHIMPVQSAILRE